MDLEKKIPTSQKTKKDTSIISQKWLRNTNFFKKINF